MRLSFNLPEPRSIERVRALFQSLARSLTGWAVSFTLVERKELEDLNGANACFTARWSDGPVTLSESLTCGSGNPRDGYGYDLELTLVLPTHKLEVRSGGYEPISSPMVIEVNSSAREWLKLREVVRKELGVENDLSFAPWTAAGTIVELASGGEQAAALELARESLSRANATASGRENVVAWLARNDASAGGVPMRVREAPADLEAWLELERAGDTTLAETFARLCPFDLKRWKAAGLPTAPWFDHPLWPFEREAAPEGEWHTMHLRPGSIGPALPATLSRVLTGWESGTHWQELRGESLPGADGWRWEVSRRARYPEGSKVPVVHVTLLGARRAPEEWALPPLEQYAREYKELMRWSWIAGMRTEDVVLVGERSLPLANRGPTPGVAAIAYAVMGSSEFRSRIAFEVAKFTKLKWYPVSRRESLEPWKRPAPAFTDVEGALAATLAPAELARVKELMQCRCADPHCSHRIELRRTSQQLRFSHRPAESARGHAWAAAAAMTELPPDLDSAATRVRDAHEELLHAAEYVEVE